MSQFSQTDKAQQTSGGPRKLYARLSALLRPRNSGEDGLRDWFRSYASRFDEEMHVTLSDTVRQVKTDMAAGAISVDAEFKQRSEQDAAQFLSALNSELSSMHTSLLKEAEEHSGRALDEFNFVAQRIIKERLETVNRKLQESNFSAGRLEQVIKNLFQQAQQNYCTRLTTLLDQENRRTLQEIDAVTRSELETAGKVIKARVATTLEEALAKATGELRDDVIAAARAEIIDELEKTKQELRGALEREQNKLLDRYSVSAERYLAEILDQTKNRLKADMEAESRQMLPSGVEDLKNAIDETANGVLSEFVEVARGELAAALERFREENTNRLNAASAAANKSIEELSKKIEQDIAELKEVVAERTLRLRDQLRLDEDAVLEQTVTLKNEVDDALQTVRNKATNAIGKCEAILTKLDRQTKKIQSDTGTLESRHASIDARLASLAQNLSELETKDERLVVLSLQLSDQTEASLNAIESEAARAHEYLSTLSSRTEDLRRRAEEAVKNYEARVAAVRRELSDEKLEETARNVAEQARKKMDSELEYHLLGFRRELEEVEKEVLHRASVAERAMVHKAALLVRSKRSEQYASRTPNSQEGKADKEEKMRRPPCPSCGKRLRYISQYARWYCDFCRKYAPREVEREIEENSENRLMTWYEQVWKHPSALGETEQR